MNHLLATKAAQLGIDLPEDYELGQPIDFTRTKSGHGPTGVIHSAIEPVAGTKSVDGSTRSKFRALANAYGVVDLQNEVIEKGAFADDDGKSGHPILWNHGLHIPAIGVVTKVTETDIGPVVDFELDEADELAVSMARKLEKGYIRTVSVGFWTLEGMYKEDPDGEVRFHITKGKLFELSIVNVPANPFAVVITSAPEGSAKSAEEADPAGEDPAAEAPSGVASLLASATVDVDNYVLNEDGSVDVPIVADGQTLGTFHYVSEQLAEEGVITEVEEDDDQPRLFELSDEDYSELDAISASFND